MPLSMITSYQEITEKELGVLQRQYERSHFYINRSTEQPTKLAIFDFDSTLFFSPLLSPTIWHPNLIRVATTESVYGPGWWRDIRSLDLGPFEELQKSAWKGFWNEDIVNEARQCISDPDTMTVVLTGRRFHPFHLLIPAMLEAKGLQFDLIGLRPDPESVSDNHWEVMQDKQHLTYNLTSSVFRSTMHFKTCFILNLIHNVSSINHVSMWDDRMHHVRRFREYLDAIKSKNVIKQGDVVYVPGIRPKYNPDWEKLVIRQIIQTHNKALMTHRRDGIKNGKIEQRLKWNTTFAEKEDPLETASHPLQLFPLPAATIIKLSAQCTEQLQKVYEPIFTSQLEKNRKSQLWKDVGGEQPVYFGDSVYLSQKVLNSKSISVGTIGSEVNITIKAYSDSPQLASLLLQVQVNGDDQNDYLLPLWFKPSEYIELFRMKDVKWIPIEHVSISGKIDFAYRLGVVEKTAEKRRRDSTSEKEEENTSVPFHSRRRL